MARSKRRKRWMQRRTADQFFQREARRDNRHRSKELLAKGRDEQIADKPPDWKWL